MTNSELWSYSPIFKVKFCTVSYFVTIEEVFVQGNLLLHISCDFYIFNFQRHEKMTKHSSNIYLMRVQDIFAKMLTYLKIEKEFVRNFIQIPISFKNYKNRNNYSTLRTKPNEPRKSCYCRVNHNLRVDRPILRHTAA